MFQSSVRHGLAQEEIHDVLRNERRRNVLRHIRKQIGKLTVRELAEAIAEAETGESPPPRNIRQSVYNSLHQTHLPKLDALDLIEYNRDRKTVSMKPNIRQVDIYMEITTPYRITWSEYYQLLTLLVLLIIIAVDLGVPLLSSASSLVWATLFLAVLGVSTGYRMWSRRFIYIQELFS